MSIEALLAENTAALNANTEQLKLMNAGREEAISALTSQAAAGAAPKTTRAKKGETATAPAAEVKTPAGPDVSDDAMRGFVGGWLKSTEDKDEQAARGLQLKSVLEHFSASALAGDNGIKSEDERRQALFFITRFKEGLTVDFGADYDFDADPLTQGDLEPAADDTADDDDLLG